MAKNIGEADGTKDNWAADVCVASSGNVYGLGSQTHIGVYSIVVSKYNSSGVIQFIRRFYATGDSSLNSSSGGIVTDSSENVYFAGVTDSPGASGGRDFLLVKLNSSGVIQWQRYIGDTGNGTPYDLTIDGSDNLYIIGYSNLGAGGDGTLIAKYNSSGVIQWQRKFTNNLNTSYDSLLAIDIYNNSFAVAGYTDKGTYRDGLIAVFPTDGTETGTYGDFTYSASTFTDKAGDLLQANLTIPEFAANLSVTTTTITEQAGNWTNTIHEKV